MQAEENESARSTAGPAASKFGADAFDSAGSCGTLLKLPLLDSPLRNDLRDSTRPRDFTRA